MAAFGEQNLTRKSLLEFAQSQSPLLAQRRDQQDLSRPVSARSTSTSSPRSTPNGCGSTGCTPATARCSPRCTRCSLNLADYVEAVDRPGDRARHQPAGDERLLRLPDRHAASTSSASTCSGASRDVAAGARPARRRGQRASATASRRAHRRDQRPAHPTRRHLRRRARRQRHAGDHQASQDTERVRLVYGVVPAADVGRGRRVRGEARDETPPRTAGEVLEALALDGPGSRDLVRDPRPTRRRRLGQHPRPGRHVHLGGVEARPTSSATACRTAGARTCWSRSSTIAARRHAHRPRLLDVRRAPHPRPASVRGRACADPRGAIAVSWRRGG